MKSSKTLRVIGIVWFVFIGMGFLQVAGQDAKQPMEIHCKHFFHGYPLGTPASNDLIIRDIYAMSNNDNTKFADWLAYRLSGREILGIGDTERQWRQDPWLSEDETLEPDDYDGASKPLVIDRGHQAPLASFKGSIWAPMTNFLSNITPQKQDLNRGPWKNLEETGRDIVKTGKVVYVMTGPLYEKDMPKLPNCKKPHQIPSGYWKILFVTERSGIGDDMDNFQWAAFIFPQETPRTDRIISYLTTIDEVEKRSKLDFLWQLEDKKEAAIEKDTNKSWAQKVFVR